MGNTDLKRWAQTWASAGKGRAFKVKDLRGVMWVDRELNHIPSTMLGQLGTSGTVCSHLDHYQVKEAKVP